MNNWIATNTTGSYCLSKSHTHHITSSSHVLKCLPPARTQARRRWRHSPLVQRPRDAERPTRCWCVVSVRRRLRPWCDRLACKAHTTRCSQPGDSRFSMILWSLNIMSWRMRYPVWIHCCKWPKYDFCISKGSVATVLRWDGQKLQSFMASFYIMHAKTINLSANFSRSCATVCS